MLLLATGPIVRVSPEEVDVTDLASTKEVHTVKATYIKAPQFYHALRAPGAGMCIFDTFAYIVYCHSYPSLLYMP